MGSWVGVGNKLVSIFSEEICVNYLGRNVGKFSLYLPYPSPYPQPVLQTNISYFIK